MSYRQAPRGVPSSPKSAARRRRSDRRGACWPYPIWHQRRGLITGAPRSEARSCALEAGHRATRSRSAARTARHRRCCAGEFRFSFPDWSASGTVGRGRRERRPADAERGRCLVHDRRCPFGKRTRMRELCRAAELGSQPNADLALREHGGRKTPRLTNCQQRKKLVAAGCIACLPVPSGHSRRRRPRHARRRHAMIQLESRKIHRGMT
jgi:hypothetical protein